MKLKTKKIFLPVNLNFILIKKYNNIVLIIFDKNNFFKFFLKNKNFIKINKNTNVIEIKNKYLDNKNYTFKNKLYKFFEKLNDYYFIKIKFKGKGYKLDLFKKLKLLNFNFGKSHKSMVLYKNIKIIKYKKYKLILFANNLQFLKKNSNIITKIKKINEYTGRGLRKSRQIIIKRKGKKGSFV